MCNPKQFNCYDNKSMPNKKLTALRIPSKFNLIKIYNHKMVYGMRKIMTLINVNSSRVR